MKIALFKRDGKPWADYTRPADAKPIREIEAHTRAEIEHVIASPGDECPHRVKALAERALKELLAKQTPRPTDPPDSLREIAYRSFWGRLKWLVTGR